MRLCNLSESASLNRIEKKKTSAACKKVLKLAFLLITINQGIITRIFEILLVKTETMGSLGCLARLSCMFSRFTERAWSCVIV